MKTQKLKKKGKVSPSKHQMIENYQMEKIKIRIDNCSIAILEVKTMIDALSFSGLELLQGLDKLHWFPINGGE